MRDPYGCTDQSQAHRMEIIHPNGRAFMEMQTAQGVPRPGDIIRIDEGGFYDTLGMVGFPREIVVKRTAWSICRCICGKHDRIGAEVHCDVLNTYPVTPFDAEAPSVTP